MGFLLTGTVMRRLKQQFLNDTRRVDDKYYEEETRATLHTSQGLYRARSEALGEVHRD